MPYRVYVRWPDQRTSDKTTTEDREVAEFAFAKLTRTPDLPYNGALGIAFTHNGSQIDYVAFVQEKK